MRELHLIAECLAHVAQPYWPQGDNPHISSISLYYCYSSRLYSREPKDTQFSAFSPMSSSHPASPPHLRSITHSTQQASLLGAVVTTWSLMLIAVSLRFGARRLSKTTLWYDDWLIMPAAVRQGFVPYLIMYTSGQEPHSESVWVSAFCHNMLCLSYLEWVTQPCLFFR